LKTEDIMQAV